MQSQMRVFDTGWEAELFTACPALTKKLELTTFTDRRGYGPKQKTASLIDLSACLAQTPARSKAEQPHFKMGRFGKVKSDKGSYRTNENFVSVTGIEVDYDAGIVTPDQAAKTLAAACVAALVVTSASHGQPDKGNRWRVVCPLSAEVAPQERAALVARVNGVLGGILGAESFTAVQSFGYGHVEGRTKPLVRLIEGRFLDECGDLDAGAIGKPSKTDLGEPQSAVDQSDDLEAVAHARERLEAAATRLAETAPGENRNGVLNRAAFEMGGLVACSTLDRGEVIEVLLTAAGECGYVHDYGGETEVVRVIEAGMKQGMAHPLPYLDALQLDDLDNLPDADSDTESRPPFFTDAADLLANPAPPREWHVEGWFPARTVHLMMGDGGTGKSLLALQMAAATATGTPWIGLDVSRPGPVVYYGAEDDMDEMHRRLAGICEAMEIGAECFRGKLHMRSAVAEDSIFATVGPDGRVKPTKLLKRINREIAAVQPRLVILDTLANLHALDPNNQEQARAFVGFLVEVAQTHDCSVLLLAHPSRSGMASGGGDGFSVGWSNSVRSRSYLRADKDAPDVRVLENLKANYGPHAAAVQLMWNNGALVPVAADYATAETAKRVFLEILDRFSAQGQIVNNSKTGTYAPKIFAEEPEAEGLPVKVLEVAMRSLLAAEIIQLETFRENGKNRKRLVRGHFDLPSTYDLDELEDDSEC
jgi:methylmalonyl-CoA mutase cobalamin-binding subunit